jgi:hypothetical protein
MAISPKPVDRGERFVAEALFTNNKKQQSTVVLGYFDTQKEAADLGAKWLPHININSVSVRDRGAKEEEQDIGTETDE